MLWQKLLGANAAGGEIKYVGSYVQGFIGTTSNTTISLTSLTGGLASAPAAGDLVIVYFGTGSTADRNLTVSGYTEVGEVYSNDSVDTNLVVAYKFMGSTPDTGFTLTSGTGSTADAGAVYVSVWRGVDTTVTQRRGHFGTDTNSVLPNPPSTTPDTAGAYIVAGGAGGHNNGTQTFSSSDLTDFRSVGADDTNDVTIGGGYKEWTSGVFDPAQFTFSGSDSSQFSNASCTMSFVPEQNGATPPTYITSAKANSITNVLVISKPSGTIEGDFMLAFMAANEVGTWSGDTGWTEIAAQTGGARPATRVAYKIAGASEGGSYTFTHSQPVDTRTTGTILAFRNATYETASSVVDITTRSTVPTPAVTTAYNLLVGYIARDDNENFPSMEMATLNSETGGVPWLVGVEVVPAGQYNRFFERGGPDTNASAVLVVLKTP